MPFKLRMRNNNRANQLQCGKMHGTATTVSNQWANYKHIVSKFRAQLLLDSSRSEFIYFDTFLLLFMSAEEISLLSVYTHFSYIPFHSDLCILWLFVLFVMMMTNDNDI